MRIASQLDPATRQALARAALAHAAQNGWAGVRIGQLAARAGRPVQDFYPASPRDAILAIEEAFDQEIAASALPEAEEPRERLFELCMRRFEAMEPHRAALAAIAADDPLAHGLLLKASMQTAHWLLGLAGLDDGPLAPLRTGPLALLLARARKAWQQDVEGDFARTLVSLDRDLRRAEEAQGHLDSLSAWLRGVRRPGGGPDGNAQDRA